MLESRGADFIYRPNFNRIMYCRPQNFFGLFFFKYDMKDVNLGYFFVTKIAMLCIQNLTQGPQKIFGGPHFGHPCYNHSNLASNDGNLEKESLVDSLFKMVEIISLFFATRMTTVSQ